MQVLLEYSEISKQTMQLEKDENTKQFQQHLSLFNITDYLGQFLRFLHLILINHLEEQSESAHLYPTNPSLNQIEN
jgi:hypothetical protein